MIFTISPASKASLDLHLKITIEYASKCMQMTRKSPSFIQSARIYLDCISTGSKKERDTHTNRLRLQNRNFKLQNRNCEIARIHIQLRDAPETEID